MTFDPTVVHGYRPATMADDEPIARARGLIFCAVDLLPSTHDATLIACDAWSDLDEPGILPQVIPHIPIEAVSPAELLVQARAALILAITITGSPTRMLACATSARTIDVALTFLGDTAKAAIPTRPE